MTGEKSMLPSADDVIANAGAFGQQLGLGALAGYVSGRFARAGATVSSDGSSISSVTVHDSWYES